MDELHEDYIAVEAILIVKAVHIQEERPTTFVRMTHSMSDMEALGLLYATTQIHLKDVNSNWEEGDEA
jgi:hypothetical protein